jgi:hypothetical protein
VYAIASYPGIIAMVQRFGFSMKIRGFTVCTTLSSILEVFTSRPSVQIGWLQNRRNLLQGTNLVDRNQVIVGEELNNYE